MPGAGRPRPPSRTLLLFSLIRCSPWSSLGLLPSTLQRPEVGSPPPPTLPPQLLCSAIGHPHALSWCLAWLSTLHPRPHVVSLHSPQRVLPTLLIRASRAE